MTFMHKLSQRLARLWTILAMAAAAACYEQRPASVTDPGATVSQIVVVPESVTLNPAQQATFAAYGRSAAGDSMGVQVTWSASGGTIAPTGAFVAGTAGGDFQVTASSAMWKKAAAAQVHVRSVGSVTVSPAAASVTVGQTVQFTATPKDVNGYVLTGWPVTWTSSNASIATVSVSGLVMGLVAGPVAITATSGGKTATATVTVSVVPVASVALTPAAVNATVGQMVQLTATPKDASGTALVGRVVTWATTNAAVATVSGGGLLTGMTAGSVSITASCEGKSNTVTATVSFVPVASVAVTPAAANVTVGQTAHLTATPQDASGTPLAGRAVTWMTSNAAVATVSSSGLVTGVAVGPATITATSEGQSGTAAITVTAASGPPGSVTNLTVVSVTTNSVTVSFTEVNDGTGLPASYYLRYAVGTISWGTATELPPLTGNAIGATRSYTVPGLAASTSYQFQVVAFRGTPNVNAVFGLLSNVASGTTAASSAPVASVTVSPAAVSLSPLQTRQLTATLKDAGGSTLTGRPITWASSSPAAATVSGSGMVTGVAVGTATITATSEGQTGSAAITVTVATGGLVFQSDWSTATGTSLSAVTDGGRWLNYWEFNGGTTVQLLSVVPGGPGGRNALRVLQRGSSYAADLQQDNVVPPSTDFYVRFYMRNDDTSPAGDHAVEPGLFADSWNNLIYVRKTSGANGWQEVLGTITAGYPVYYWYLRTLLSLGVWYRFEYWVHFVDATHIQVQVRIYDVTGTLLYSDADFRQEDFGGSPLWNGSNTWTLAAFNAAGYSAAIDPTKLVNFVMGNNGQAGAADNGLAWYFAGLEIRTDHWPGP